MDKIRFEVIDAQLENNNLKTYNVEIFLNGKALKDKMFNTCEVLAASSRENVTFDLLTCECGYPACAGFNKPVIQTKTAETIKWTFPDDGSYDVQKKEFEFDQSEFNQQFSQLKSLLLKLEEQKNYLVDMLADTYEEVERYEVRSSIAQSLDCYEKTYQAKEKLNNMLNKNFPNLVGHKFNLVYENYSSAELTLNYLVCRMINQFPALNNSEDFESQLIQAGKAIEKIKESNYHDFYEVIHKGIGKFNAKDKNDLNESVFYLVSGEIVNLTQEEYNNFQLNFDIKKIILNIS